MVEDARYRTKDFLTDVTIPTGIQAANILKDDGVTQASFIVAYGYPDYPLERVFLGTKNVDLVYAILKPTSVPLLGGSTTPWGYEESVPIDIRTITKQGITGTKLMWQGEAELRRICETYPLGSSRRNLSESRDITESGSTTIYGVRVVMSYRRGIT